MAAPGPSPELFLIHSARPARPLPARPLLLDTSYRRQLEWEDAAGEAHPPVPAGPLVERAAQSLRRPFLELMAKLGRRRDSLAWWVSRVSERNTLVSPLFLHCCYLAAAAEELRRDEPLCVVCESPAVLEALDRLASDRGVHTTWLERAPRRGPWWPAALRRIASFAVLEASRRRASPSLPEPETDRPVALVRTWVDEGCFERGGGFRDRYFPGVAKMLERRGLAAMTLPVLFSLRRSHRNAWRALERAGGTFLPDAPAYRLRDYLFAARVGLRSAQIRLGEVVVYGLDVGPLFEEERRRAACDPATLAAALSSRLPLRLRERGIDLALLVEPYENAIPEKAFRWGFRRHAPAAKLVGYQHSPLDPMLLNLFVTAAEAEFAPLPDRMVTIGPRFRELLVEAGFPAERAAVGPALRSAHLWRRAEGADGERSREELVLVTLPLVPEIAQELLDKTVAALGGLDGVRAAIKPHPMAGAGQPAELPPGFEIVGGDLEEWLRKAAVGLGIASAAVFELLAAGVPAVAVGTQAGLPLNPLWWHPRLGRVMREPGEIREAVQRALAMPADELGAYRAEAREVLESSFEPVTDEGMGVFAEGLVGGGSYSFRAREGSP